MQVPSTPEYSGLHNTCQAAIFAAQYQEDLTQAINEITKPFPNPPSEQDMQDRAAAYENLAALRSNDSAYLNLQKLVPGSKAEALYQDCMGKLDAYMDSIQIYAPVPDGTDSHPKELPLHHGNYDGKIVTLKDMINNLINKSDEDFVYRDRLHNDKVQDCPWISKGDIKMDSDGTSNGIHWGTPDCTKGFHDKQNYFDALATAQNWEKYVTGKPTDATQGAYDALMKALNPTA